MRILHFCLSRKSHLVFMPPLIHAYLSHAHRRLMAHPGKTAARREAGQLGAVRFICQNPVGAGAGESLLRVFRIVHGYVYEAGTH